ncbi:MAG TPA: hypothetical protein VGJ15_06455 [Pirellulales bacterium]|jgi:hypothetical protein
MLNRTSIAVIALGLAATATLLFAQAKDSDKAKDKPLPPGVTRVAVEFAGGHDTDPQDKGRPVVLVAGGLGVKPEVFREAFSHVKPAPAGTEPDPEQVRKNKAALMDALSKFGITNDRLDTVSNYYRYVRSRGELWTIKPARAYALVKDGAVIGFEIENGGAGYSSPPTVGVPKIKMASPKVELAFSKELEKNGAVASISLSSEKDKGKSKDADPPKAK